MSAGVSVSGPRRSQLPDFPDHAADVFPQLIFAQGASQQCLAQLIRVAAASRHEEISGRGRDPAGVGNGIDRLLVRHPGHDPVGHDDAPIAEFIAQDPPDQALMLGGMAAVEEIIRGHQGMGLRLPDADLKALEIDLAHGALADDAVVVITVVFLVVRGIMLDGGSLPGMGLDPQGDRRGKGAAQERVLREVFKVPAAADAPVDVQRGREPEVHVHPLHLVPDDVPALPRKIRVPALGQRGSDSRPGDPASF